MVGKLILLIKQALIFPFKILMSFISLVFPKNNKLWLFSSWEGNAFNDNSKYFFIYVNKHCPEITPIWITRKSNVESEIAENGFKVFLLNEFISMFYMLRAGAIFTTHGLNDFYPCFVYGSTHFELWHATMPIKRMQYDSDNFVPKSFLKRFKLFIQNPFLFKKVDYSISSTEHLRKIASSSLMISNEKILLTGQPRSDVFFTPTLKTDESKILKVLNLAKYKKIIYYIPTFRNDPGFSFFSSDLSFDLKKLVTFLKDNEAVMIFRLHPFDLNRLDDFSKYECEQIIFEKSGISDPYPLLKKCDVLITDYSSIFADFTLVKRPVVFASFKHDDYLKKERALYWDYDHISKGCRANNWNELLDVLNLCLKGQVSTRQDLFDFIYPVDHKDNSKKLYEAVKAILQS